MAAKIPASDGSFEERVNRIIDKRLQDPTRLPTEFRSFLPRFIETQDIRLPISQVQGLYLTETNTTSLGGDVHGRIGMVRAGSAPYEFTQVTFDAVYDKWVSNAVLVATMSTTDATTTSTTYVSASTGTVSVIPWAPFDTAGMKPQFRCAHYFGSSSGAQTAYATIQFQPIADDGTTGTLVNSSTFEDTTTATASFEFKAWNDVDGSVTLDDWLLVKAGIKISGGGATCTLYTHDIWLRWVSK